ncbi:MAG TPA: tetratricopeptide repeat protein [Pyrinomonadaceae bacterium]|nr:tetratricopeptide repeat protein [Pyrinomonadaceae bacterium]
MLDDTTLPRLSQIRTPRRTHSLALLLAVACTASAAHAQGGRKPTVPEQVETGSKTTATKPSNETPAPPLPAVAPDPSTTAAAQAVRERRVSAQPAASRPAANVSLNSEAAPAARDGVAVSRNEASGVEAELEELRAQILAAKTDAERGRLQRALVERLTALQRNGDAITVLRTLMREERFDPVGFYNIGNSLARLDDAQAAAEAYRKAIAQKNGNYSRAQNNLGVVLIRLGHWEEASDALTAALRLENGNYAEASYNMGRIHALRGEAGRAITEWMRALSLEPDHADAAVALARAFAAEGEPERGLKVLDAFTTRLNRRGVAVPREIAIARGEIVAAGNIVASERGGRITTEERSGDNAAASASKSSLNTNAALRAEAPRTSSAGSLGKSRQLTLSAQGYDLLQRARAARDDGRHEQAVAFYRRVLSQQDGYFPPANLELGYALTALQRMDEALAAILPVANRDGARYPIAFYHLGRLYERAGQLNAAAEAFARAVSLYGDTNPQMLLDVSRVREKEGNLPAALSALEDYVRVIERLGSVPDWARERLTQLRQKANAPKP